MFTMFVVLDNESIRSVRVTSDLKFGNREKEGDG